jgi:hypothetical protein
MSRMGIVETMHFRAAAPLREHNPATTAQPPQMVSISIAFSGIIREINSPSLITSG